MKYCTNCFTKLYSQRFSKDWLCCRCLPFYI